MKKNLMYVTVLVFVCLTIRLFPSLAYGAATVSSANTIFIAGSSGNSVTINITGATNNQAIVITPPTGWAGTAAGASVSSGSANISGGTMGTAAITVTPTAAGDITIVYTAKVGTTVGLVDFTVTEGGTDSAAMSVDVVVDGSGIISFKQAETDAAEDQIAGQTAQTINMYYTVVGSAAGILSGGSLILDIPSAFATPTASTLKVTKGNGTAADIGTVAYIGNKVTVPLTTLNGGDQLKISYSNVTIPAVATYKFSISTASSSPAFGVPFKVGNLVLTVRGADIGSGTVVASGGPYSAGSSGNTITFKYTADGTMTGGRIEIIPPPGWTDPQGEPGQPGYTIVRGPDGAQYATSDVIFGVSAAEGFSGNGVGIKVGTLEFNQVLTVIYGYTGAASGATAAASTGISRFEVNSTPNASLDDGATTDADSLADPATKFTIANQPKVSVQASDGSGGITATSTIFIAGSQGNSVTINIPGATNAQGITITPPAGWIGAGVTVSSGSATATGGTAAVPVISVSPTAAGDITIVYTATAGTTADLVSFTVTEVGQTATSFSVDVVADGSGVLSFRQAVTEAAQDQQSGQTAQTIDMYYTAVGNSAGVLSGGTLVLDIPSAFAAPTSTNLAVTKGDGTAATGVIGTIVYAGNKVTVPLTVMNGGDQLKISYSNVTIPAAATYNFSISTASSSPAFGVPFKVGDLALTLTVRGAGVGTGTVVASGGPYSAASTGNSITFTYTAAGTMTGGRIEIIPPDGWTDPQGEPGQPGYTIARGPDGAQYATSDVIFDVSVAAGFSGNGVGIKVGTLELNQALTVIYGYTGAASGAKAASTTGFSRFEVNSTPNASLDNGLIADGGIDDDSLADTENPNNTGFSTAN